MSSICSFSDIIGQKESIAHLQNAIRTGRLSHAYILCGEKGTGGEELAYAAAAVLECAGPVVRDGLTEPCGRCHSCLQMSSGNHPDVIRITHRKKNEADRQTALGVEDIRRMRADVMIRPYSGEYKVYILPDAENMTQQAQNALLKTLEEPPAYAVIFLLAQEITSFLPTVLSRCVLLRMHAASDSELVPWLEKKYGIAHEKAGYIAGLSHGNAGMAVRMAESESFREIPSVLARFLRNLRSTDSFEITQFAEKAADGKVLSGPEVSADDAKEGVGLDLLLEWMQDWFRDLLVYKSTGRTDNLIFYEDVQYIISAAESLSYEALSRIEDAFLTAAKRRRAGGNDAQILEMLLLCVRACM